MDWKQIIRDLCWYFGALLVTVPYLFALYCMAPLWIGIVFTGVYLGAALAMMRFEEDEFSVALTALVLAAMPPVGYAMSSEPPAQRHFDIHLRLYAIGLGFVALAWCARRAFDWHESRNERRSSQ